MGRKLTPLHDWTDGCIAVTNEEMDELWMVNQKKKAELLELATELAFK
jgi:hypothetical protein